nr:dehydrogenase/reductase SDR family member 4-like isoform X2 [Cherax quadricarinatus]
MVAYQILGCRLGQAAVCVRMMSSNTAVQQSAKLAGKIAIVTASTDGIGLAIARRLGEDGAHVVVSSRKQTNVDSAVAELKGLGCSVLGFTCHVAKEQDRQNLISKTLEKFGGIDILVSNAAVNPAVGGVLDCPESVWDKIFEINVKNALQLSQLVVPHMQERGGGAIVYISSIAGFQPMNLTQHPAVYEKILETIPLGRIAETKEMAGLVSFLCSSDASYITGESFIAAGGMQSRL